MKQKRWFNSATCNSNKKWNNDKCQSKCKNYHMRKKDYSWNPTRWLCKNSMYLKSVADDSVIVCDEIINVKESISTNVLSTVPINFDDKKVNKK